MTKNLVAVAAASGQAIDIISAVGQCIEFLEVRGVRAVNVWGKQKAAAARLIEV